MKLIFLFVITTSVALAASPLYVDASAGVLFGHYDAYHGGVPAVRHERALRGFAPAVGVGYAFTPRFALEEEFDGYGTYEFNNEYVSGSEHTQNRLNERLWAATTRCAVTFPLAARFDFIVAPGLEYQSLRQTVTYLQAWTVPFSLAQVVPDPTTTTDHFWRPDLDLRLVWQMNNHVSCLVGYRVVEAAQKTLSRVAAGLTMGW